MTDFEIVKYAGKIRLDITEVKKVFVTEDETCIEVTVSHDDLKQLMKTVAIYLAEGVS